MEGGGCRSCPQIPVKEYILFYMFALSGGLENQANTSTCTSNAISAYYYKKHLRADLEGEGVKDDISPHSRQIEHF